MKKPLIVISIIVLVSLALTAGDYWLWNIAHSSIELDTTQVCGDRISSVEYIRGTDANGQPCTLGEDECDRSVQQVTFILELDSATTGTGACELPPEANGFDFNGDGTVNFKDVTIFAGKMWKVC